MDGIKGLNQRKLYPNYKLDGSAILEIEGMPLHYRATGDPQAPAVVLIHGVLSSLHTWQAWQEQLSHEFYVISFDVPGFGLTGSHPKSDYSVDMYNRVITALLQHLNVKDCYLAGSSFGGLLSWEYALHAPQRVQKMILLDASGIHTSPKEVKNIGFKLFLNPFTAPLAHYFTPKAILHRLLKGVYGDVAKVSSELAERYWALLLRKGNRTAFSTILSKTILHGQSHTTALQQIQTPTLILWGDQDHLLPVRHAQEFHQLLPNSSLKIYKGVGHVPMEEIPQLSVKDAVDFFKA